MFSEVLVHRMTRMNGLAFEERTLDVVVLVM